MIHSLRVFLYGLLHNFIEPIGLYAAYTLNESEFVGTLQRRGRPGSIGLHLPDSYEYTFLSAVKTHPDGEQIEDGSYRKVATEHPDIDARITREFEPAECQYHVHTFGDEVFSHYELRPDIVGTMREHYRPEWGETYLLGVSCPEIDELLD